MLRIGRVDRQTNTHDEYDARRFRVPRSRPQNGGPQCDLRLFHAALDHDCPAILTAAQQSLPYAKILAASY